MYSLLEDNFNIEKWMKMNNIMPDSPGFHICKAFIFNQEGLLEGGGSIWAEEIGNIIRIKSFEFS